MDKSTLMFQFGIGVFFKEKLPIISTHCSVVCSLEVHKLDSLQAKLSQEMLFRNPTMQSSY